jgi:hypothetical protein
MPTTQSISITAAKSRPMLTWVGKHQLHYVTAFPAQAVEGRSAPADNAYLTDTR